ncbi:ATP synthase I subunit [Plasticicumulans acidivorans]|uniref:ATP synthase I subunit n=2 Tax=Plasticicumulans acidivorans TaxID=886464 RepID=A0A317MVR6_9GAMM|nr:ATP synthase I subunit [Plasticicumulans acidivorans]
MAQALYIGEAVKLVLTVLLFAVALVLFDLEFLPLILTYAATLAAYWLALL